MRKLRILLADDHSIVLEGLRRVLEPEFQILGTAQNGYELLDQVLLHDPEVVVSDLSMPGLTGLEVLRRVRAAKLRTRFVILTMHSDPDIAGGAYGQGASGYVLKQSAATELPRAVRAAAAGELYVDPSLEPDGPLNFAHRSRKPNAPAPELTEREREVLKLVAEGRMLKEIAGLLHISESTAGFHKYNMMRKLKLRTTAALTKHAIRAGIVAAENEGAPAC
jgi:DNA-binding NarL/FixJ family response regulator